MEIGNKIKKAMLEKGMSFYTLSKLTGVQITNIKRIIRVNNGRYSQVEKIKKVLGIK